MNKTELLLLISVVFAGISKPVYGQTKPIENHPDDKPAVQLKISGFSST